jgi:hypothetical protein
VGRWDARDSLIPYSFTFNASGRFETDEGCKGGVTLDGSTMRLVMDPGQPAKCFDQTHTWALAQGHLVLDGVSVFVDREREFRLQRQCLIGYWKLGHWTETAITGDWSLEHTEDEHMITLTEPSPERDRVAFAFNKDGTGSATWDVLLSVRDGGHSYALRHTAQLAFTYRATETGLYYTITKGQVNDKWFLDGRQVGPYSFPISNIPYEFQCGPRLDLSIPDVDDVVLDRTSTPPTAGTPV